MRVTNQYGCPLCEETFESRNASQIHRDIGHREQETSDNQEEKERTVAGDNSETSTD
jgi:hypothetical protein